MTVDDITANNGTTTTTITPAARGACIAARRDGRFNVNRTQDASIMVRCSWGIRDRRARRADRAQRCFGADDNGRIRRDWSRIIHGSHLVQLDIFALHESRLVRFEMRARNGPAGRLRILRVARLAGHCVTGEEVMVEGRKRRKTAADNANVDFDDAVTSPSALNHRLEGRKIRNRKRKNSRPEVNGD